MFFGSFIIYIPPVCFDAPARQTFLHFEANSIDSYAVALFEASQVFPDRVRENPSLMPNIAWNLQSFSLDYGRS
jgi:hypothetical protein